MNKTKLMFALLASLVLGACSSDDSEDAAYTVTEMTEAPVWQMDWTNNQARPNWTQPAAIYENWTTMMVQIEKTLQPYASQQDLMAIFINDELRGLASPAVVVDSEESSSTKYLMKVWGNEKGTETVKVTLKYYSQQLQHIFSLSDNIRLDADVTTGIKGDFIPEFTLGSAKYPVVKAINISTISDIIAVAKLQPATGDTFAAFVADECRGIGSGNTLILYGREVGESATLKYYQAATGKLYTFENALQVK